MQIMQADLPHTLYKRDKKGNKRAVTAENYKYNPKDPAIEKTMESLRRRERMAKGEDGLSTDELFNKQ